MNANEQLKAVFLAALDTPADRRAACLDELCDGDAALRRRVEALLRAHGRTDRLLDRPAEAPSEEPPTGPHAPIDLPAFLGPATKPGAVGRLGHFEVLQVAGRGGMGVVFRAFDEKLQRVVAIKMLAPHLAAQESARRRFVREARAAAAISHDNVVAIYGVEDGGAAPWLVMPFIEGTTLLDKLASSGALPVAEAVRIGEEIARGLAAAHGHGLVHRDIKPANVLLDKEGRARIADFGLARAVDDAALTQEGAVAGTPAYMSPEQARGEAVDARSDLFSLGSVLYEMCTGRRAFQADGSHATLRRVCEEEPRPARKVNPEVPPWLSDLVCRLHSKSPARRPASADEVADVLARRAGPGRRVSGWVVGAILLVGPVAGLGVWWRPARSTSPPDPRAEARPEAEEKPAKPPPAVESEATRWEQGVAALATHEGKAKAVVARLKELNPEWDGKHEYQHLGNEVTALLFPNQVVTNLAPLRALPSLVHIDCCGGPASWKKGKLEDLSPLKGLSLKRLHCRMTKVADLSPLRGMPLEELLVSNTEVVDLSPLAGMPLFQLDMSNTPVKDLSPLKGLKGLSRLSLNGVPAPDLSFLKGLPLTYLGARLTEVDLATVRGLGLKEIGLSYEPGRHRTILRSMKGVEKINGWPAGEFWDRFGNNNAP